jgi:hypothetical protein
MDRERWWALWRERKEYEEFGVRHDLAAWIGHAPSPSESAVFSRTLRNMEDLDLLARISRWGGRRATHVQLTALGRAEVEKIVLENEQGLALEGERTCGNP